MSIVRERNLNSCIVFPQSSPSRKLPLSQEGGSFLVSAARRALSCFSTGKKHAILDKRRSSPGRFSEGPAGEEQPNAGGGEKSVQSGTIRLDLHGMTWWQAQVAIDAALRRAGRSVYRLELGLNPGVTELVLREY